MTTKTYTTIQGDTFESIAWKVMGNSLYQWELIRANRAHMFTAVFESGVILSIPEVKTVKEEADIPPWRRSS